MRAPLGGVCLALIAAVVVGGHTSQDPRPTAQDPQPIFRAGIELITVDVTALDSNTGRQVIDLAMKDFEVEIDGDRRQVTSAEYVRSVDPLRVIGAPHTVVVPDETFASSNAKGAPSGRLIMILADQGNIRTGSARSVMNSAKKFVDTLTPEDRVAVVAIPGPGELVDFTTNHDRVREALLRIVGQAGPLRSRFNLSVTESIALSMRSDAQLALEVILRACGAVIAAVEAERCEREVEQDAAEVVNEVRQRTADSVHGMRSVLKSLAALEGPKSVILLSEGLIFEGLSGETDDLASIAADSRATLDILLLDVPQFDVAQSQRPTTPREDRNLQVSGLEQLAGASRGQLHRINTAADFAFDRISRSLDGYYLLGVESSPEDRDGRRHRLSVKSLRRGVTIRSRRTFLTTLSAKATTPEAAVSKAIRSPLPINDLPLKLSTWTYKEPGTNKVRVLFAAEVERLAGQSLDYTAGMAMVNRQGRGVAPPTRKAVLTEKAGDRGTAVFSGVMAVDPGEYRLILAMADSEGRVGSVSRAVTAWQMDGAGVTLGDLLLGGLSDAGAPVLEPVIEPIVASGRMAALLEAYGPPSLLQSAGGPGTFTLEGTLEILTDEGRAPLATMPLRIGAGSSPEIATASAQFATTALPPGRYLARGSIRQSGKPLGHLLRPFRVAADTANGGSGTGVPSAGGALPADMVAALLNALPAFDRREVLAPAMLTLAYSAAESRATGSRAAIDEARAGDLGGAAITALGDGDQALAMFLKGLELYQQSQLDRAAVQFRNSMQLAPTFAPSRFYLGATLAEANRHREAAGLLQGDGSAPPSAVPARIAGEEWIKAGQPALAIAPLELAAQRPNPEPRAVRLLGVAYALGGRPADAVATLTPYLEANAKDPAALLAAIFGTYIRHLAAPQPATLAADRANVAKWAKAYAAAQAPMQPLVAAWVQHVQGLK